MRLGNACRPGMIGPAISVLEATGSAVISRFAVIAIGLPLSCHVRVQNAGCS